MSYRCEICGKSPHVGRQVSHSDIKTSRKWLPNVRRVKTLINGAPKRIYVCTRCLRSGKVERAQ